MVYLDFDMFLSFIPKSFCNAVRKAADRATANDLAFTGIDGTDWTRKWEFVVGGIANRYFGLELQRLIDGAKEVDPDVPESSLAILFFGDEEEFVVQLNYLGFPI